MKPLVIYHKNCNDGFGAAYAAWKKFGYDAEYLPMHYGDMLTTEIAGRDIYVLDFSFPKLLTEELMLRANSFVWLDHHKTAFENWCGEIPSNGTYVSISGESHAYIILNNYKAGCQLAWEYFWPEEDMPNGLVHIGDRDLWRFASANTRPYCAALDTHERNFVLWDALMHKDSYFEMLKEGQVLITALEQRVKSASDPKKLKEVAITLSDCTEVRGLGCNAVSDISETGNAIAQRSGTFSLTFFLTDKEVVCSLRSIGDYDVTPIARTFGGGGHKNAAGFKVGFTEFFHRIWR